MGKVLAGSHGDDTVTEIHLPLRPGFNFPKALFWKVERTLSIEEKPNGKYRLDD